MSNNRELFIQLCKANIKRDGIESLLKWLDTCDFYYAPASAKHHGNYEGGLLEHSLNVYNNLKILIKTFGFEEMFDEETIAISALFHDLCKANFYGKALKNVKEDGKWTQKEVYEINEKLPLGHGEKSCIIIQGFMHLKMDELLAIRWHMGGFDSASKGGDYGMSTAQENSKLVTLLQCADMMATIQEVKKA